MPTPEGVLHRLELHGSSGDRRSRPDRYDLDLLAQPRWAHPYRVRMEWSSEEESSGTLSWDFPTMHGALRHIHTLVERQQRLGYRLARIPRAHPYRAWREAEAASGVDDIDEDDPQIRLF